MPRHKEFEKTVILDKAVQLFWRQGYEATSVQDLVDHLGLSRSSLYDTFGDKHSLFLQALERYEACESSELTQPFQELGPGRPAIERFFEALVERAFKPNQPPGCLMVNSICELALQDSAVAQQAEANRNGIEAMFYEAIVQAQTQGDIPADRDARSLARALESAMKGLQVTARSCQERQVLTDIVTATLKMLD